MNLRGGGGGGHSKFSAQGPEFLAMALGGGTGLLIANDWKCINLPSLGIKSSFESHSVTITHSIKMHFVVVYRPPGPQGNFLDELDVLLSTFPEDGTPLVMLGDFNIHPDKPQAADFHTLLAFFISRVLTSATHKTGNQLNLIYTRHSSTDHVLVTPLHTSDHFLLNLNLDMVPDKIHTTPHVIFRRFHHPVGISTITPSKTARNLGVVIDDELTFSDYNAKTAQTCRFDLFNIKKIRPFLSEHASQLLV